MKRFSIVFFILLSLFSCSDRNKIPKDILPKEKMQAILWSMISAGEYLDGYILKKDSIDKLAESLKTYGQVFQVYHISKEEFEKSYQYYREHPDLMKVILDSLGKRQLYSVEHFEQRIDTPQPKILDKDQAQ